MARNLVFFFFPLASLSAILFCSPAPQSAPIFHAIFFWKQAVEKLVKPFFLFSTNPGLVNRGIISFSGTPF